MNLLDNLVMPRCPHCQIARPNLTGVWHGGTTNYAGEFRRHWRAYACQSCGGVAVAWAGKDGAPVVDVFPGLTAVDENLPDPARTFLSQALESVHAPAAAVMVAASAVDAMLKAKGYKDGSLYRRIDEAANAQVITVDMAKWAHQVRLDANEQRHADEQSTLPTEADARRSCDFAIALGDFMFVLPAQVTRGLKESTPQGGS